MRVEVERRRPVGARERPVVAEAREEAALVEMRPLAVLVRVDRHAVGQDAPLARRRARRLLAQEGTVEVEGEEALARGAPIAPEQVGLLEGAALVLEAPALEVRAQRRVEAGPARQRRRDAEAAARVAAAARPDVRPLLARRAAHHLDHAHEGRRPVHDGRGSTLHLDVVDVPEVERGQGRVEGAAPRHAVHDQQERVELAEPPELGHAGGRSAVAAGRDVDARGHRQSTLQVGGGAVAQLLGRDHLDRLGHRRSRFPDPARRHLDRLAVRGRRRRGLGRLGVRKVGRQQQQRQGGGSGHESSSCKSGAG